MKLLDYRLRLQDVEVRQDGANVMTLNEFAEMSVLLSCISLRKLVPFYAFWHVSMYHLSHVLRVTCMNVKWVG